MYSIHHRSATDIANSGIPFNVGMVLTAHKTVAMFMRHVHTWDKPVREAAELVASRRKMGLGNFGDHRFCHDGVWGPRIDVRPGYRVYDALSGQ